MKATKRYNLCGQCSFGYSPGTIKTFDPGCKGCKEKLADGRRTGKEPPPNNYLQKFGKVPVHVDWKKKKRLIALAKKRREAALAARFNGIS